jgi:hypothetical protein
VPASNTAVGHIILHNTVPAKRASARKAKARPAARKAKRPAAKTKRAAARVRVDVRRSR